MSNPVKARERILLAAQQCFRRLGVKGTNIQDIARAAAMARSSLYRHFRDIDDILVTLAIQAGIEDLRKLGDMIDDSSGPSEKWARLIAQMVRMARDGQRSNALFAEDSSLHVSRLFYRNQGNALAQMTQALSPYIDKAQSAREIRGDVETPLIAEWLLRQTWALSSIPLAPPWDDLDLTRYITTFVLPSVLHPRLRSSEDPEAATQLAVEVRRLVDLMVRLEARLNLKTLSSQTVQSEL